MKWKVGNEAWVEITFEPRVVVITSIDGDQVRYRVGGHPGQTTVDRLYRTQADYWTARAEELEEKATEYRLRALDLGAKPVAATRSSGTISALVARLLSAGTEMRGAQREYFRKRHREALIACKNLEAQFDRLLVQLEKVVP